MPLERLIFKKWFNSTALLLLAIGSGIIAITSTSFAKNIVQGLSASWVTVGLLQIAGSIIIVVAILMIIARWSSWVLISLFHKAADNIPILVKTKTIVRQASNRDLENIQSLGERLIEGGVSDLDHMKRWRSVNPAIFFAVKQTLPDKEPVLTGYYCLIPIKNKTVSSLLDMSISGKDFTTEHIYKGRCPKNIYIGGVAATGRLSKAAVIGALSSHISAMERRGLLKVYTKPTTRDGLKLAKKYDFKTISGGVAKLDEIHVQDAIDIFR